MHHPLQHRFGRRGRSVAALVCAVYALAAAAPASAQMGEIRFDNWLYYQENLDSSARWQYRPRFLIPFSLPQGWTFTQRADLPVFYTDRVGTDNPNGDWEWGIGDWFIEEIFATPELAKNFRMSASVRFVFPTGGSSPFGGNQYQWAPSVGATYAIPEHLVVLSPLARYFMSYHAVREGGPKVRRLDLFPGVTFGLPDDWSLAFYPENPIIYNDQTNKWFVPIDAMLIKRLSKTMTFGFGGAYRIVDDDPQYKWIVNGRLTFYF